MEEEKKPLEENITDETEAPGQEPPVSEEEPKKRKGLFGGRKRERNDKTVLGLYTVAAVYLLYVAFVTGDELISGKIPAGRDFVISTIFTIVFGGTAIWLLFTCWKLKKVIKQREEIEAAEAAEAAGESAQEGGASEPPAKKGGLLKGLFTAQKPEAPSVASRAFVYQNPADEEEDGSEPEEDSAGEETGGGAEQEDSLREEDGESSPQEEEDGRES